MYIGKARAYTNIALIKYWGKQDEQLILPMNNSLSLTLDAFYTETSVVFAEHFTKDVFFLDNIKQNDKQTEKVSAFLDLFRHQQKFSLFAKVVSHNFVPTAAGLASSASGLAALAGACNEALQLNLTNTELSRLARRGSGSACRSIFGGFAEWQKGDSDETSFAKSIASNGWEKDLAMLFVLVDDGVKDISSRDGMKRTVETSSFYPGWLQTVDSDLATAKQAIAEKDFVKLGEVTEANSLRMHGTTLAAVPPFTYWSPESLQVMQFVKKARQNGIPCYFTMDAGPNVKILVEKTSLSALKKYIAPYFSESQLITAYAGPGMTKLPIKGVENND